MNPHLVRRHGRLCVSLPLKARVVTWLGAVCQRDLQSKAHQEAWGGRVSAEKVGAGRTTGIGNVGYSICTAREE